ncbi:hypothetical protein K456DRAFT_495934 [Colletotrichum gloeosporioides 23]|nr:hypothetical protein K456DRAFT_495934 [Colletotrichum gloeosporioides 23]
MTCAYASFFWAVAAREESRAEQTKQGKATLAEHRCVEKRPSSLPSSRSSRQSSHHNPLFGGLLSFCCASTQNVAPFRLREFLRQDNSFRDLERCIRIRITQNRPGCSARQGSRACHGMGKVPKTLARSLPVFSSMYLVPRKPGHPGPPLPPPFTSCTPADTSQAVRRRTLSNASQDFTVIE